jgi:hypothetical protein
MGYRGEIELTHQQMQCLKMALDHESPKLTAIAVGKFNGDDFASRLERAIMRSTSSKTPTPPPRLLTESTSKQSNESTITQKVETAKLQSGSNGLRRWGRRW